jgi:hypothetical protein
MNSLSRGEPLGVVDNTCLPVEQSREDERNSRRPCSSHKGQHCTRLARCNVHNREEDNIPNSRLSTKYAIVNPPPTTANVSNVCFSWVISPVPCSSATASSSSFSVAESKWKTLSRQFLHGWTCNGYEKRTRIAMASCPMAMKTEVEGYIAMMFALTWMTY